MKFVGMGLTWEHMNVMMEIHFQGMDVMLFADGKRQGSILVQQELPSLNPVLKSVEMG